MPGLRCGEWSQRLIDEGEAVARPHLSGGASGDRDGDERADRALTLDDELRQKLGGVGDPLDRIARIGARRQCGGRIGLDAGQRLLEQEARSGK